MTTQKVVRAVALLAIVLVTAGSASAAGFKIVVHPSNTVSSVTRTELSEYLLKRKLTWPNGETVVPVDQPDASAIRVVVLREVFGRSASALKNYWHQQIFSGRAVPPLEKTSDQEVVAYVLTSPGAIGYVSDSAAVGKLVVVTIH